MSTTKKVLGWLFVLLGIAVMGGDGFLNKALHLGHVAIGFTISMFGVALLLGDLVFAILGRLAEIAQRVLPWRGGGPPPAGQ